MTKPDQAAPTFWRHKTSGGCASQLVSSCGPGKTPSRFRAEELGEIRSRRISGNNSHRCGCRRTRGRQHCFAPAKFHDWQHVATHAAQAKQRNPKNRQAHNSKRDAQAQSVWRAGKERPPNDQQNSDNDDDLRNAKIAFLKSPIALQPHPGDGEPHAEQEENARPPTDGFGRQGISHMEDAVRRVDSDYWSLRPVKSASWTMILSSSARGVNSAEGVM